MELLASNQPWNLILFMAIPVILAELIAITELAILFSRDLTGTYAKINRIAGIIVGFYFVGVFVYLMKTAVFPLTISGGWRGPADIIAVLSYLAGVIPLFGIAMLELGWIKKEASPEEKLKLHATFVGIFLVVAHIAMIFGMLDPGILQSSPSPMMEHDMVM